MWSIGRGVGRWARSRPRNRQTRRTTRHWCLSHISASGVSVIMVGIFSGRFRDPSLRGKIGTPFGSANSLRITKVSFRLPAAGARDSVILRVGS
jgi:hypothetical protein